MKKYKTFKSRIEALEETTGINKEKFPRPIVRLSRERPEDDKYWPDDQEDIENWITFKQSKQRTKELGMSILAFLADPKKEAQARRQEVEYEQS